MASKVVFHVPPTNQGQIVEVSYAEVGEDVIRRTHDRSIRITEYAVSQSLADDKGDYWNAAPSNKRWRKISEAEVERMMEESR